MGKYLDSLQYMVGSPRPGGLLDSRVHLPRKMEMADAATINPNKAAHRIRTANRSLRSVAMGSDGSKLSPGP